MGSTTDGRFIVLEGGDGCGKSTQAARLVERLRADGHDALHVRDPGSTVLAERVRAVLLDPSTGAVSSIAEALLYFACRAQLVDEVVAPALRAGTWVVCERWTLSTEVYQGHAGRLGVERVRELERLTLGEARPDLVVVLDVEPGAGLARLGRDLDRMEAKGQEFHTRVEEAYRALSTERRRHRRVEPGSIDEVHERVWSEVCGVVA